MKEYAAKFEMKGKEYCTYYAKSRVDGEFEISLKNMENQADVKLTWDMLFSIYRNIEVLLWGSEYAEKKYDMIREK